MSQRFNSFFKLLPACILFLSFAQCTSKSNDKPKNKIPAFVPVNTLVVRYEELSNKIEMMGTILPNEKIDLRSEIGGRVIGLYFKEGTKVKKGDVLIRIAANDLKAQLRKIRLQLQLAEAELERRYKLLEIKGISQEEFDIAENQVGTLKADADLAEAQVAKSEISAPFDGVVGLRYISEGEIISSATVIATLQQVDPIKIEFDVPEKYSREVRPGTIIRFARSGDDHIYQGSVYATEPLIDLSTRTLKARARASNKNLTLRPGSFIKLDLLLEKNPKAILIPSEALVPGALGSKVFLLRQGMALSQKVVAGTRNEKNVQITEGLSVNDTVIVSGIMQLKDSTRVNVKSIQ